MLDNPVLNQNPIKVRRAIISVYDKTGIVELARSLNNLGVELLTTGGTAKTLRAADITLTDVTDYTRFPEIMDGRVKTINPLIEGGILGLRDQHATDATKNNIKWIDLVICNLYPFSKAVLREDCDRALALENVDIGGPTMIRSAAKNAGWVCVVINPNDYSILADELRSSGEISFETRQRFSAKAFGHTAQYDTLTVSYTHLTLPTSDLV